MSTEKTWQEFYKKHQGVYSSGHFTDRTDPDAIIANEYQILYREEILTYSGKAKIAVELGCGNQPVFEVLNAFKEIWYTDISTEALVDAQARYNLLAKKEPVTTTVHFQQMNIEKLEFEDQSIDVVFNTRAPHRDETSKALVRALKKGGVYIYQTIGEQDVMDFKLLLKSGRFYDDYLQKGLTRFEHVKQSLVDAGFDQRHVTLVFDKKFKSYFESKQALKEKLWLLVGDHDFESAENVAILDEYCRTHQHNGKIFVENHRIIIKAER